MTQLAIVLVVLLSLVKGTYAASLSIELTQESDQEGKIYDIVVLSTSESEITNLILNPDTVSLNFETSTKLSTDTVFDTFTSVATTHFTQPVYFSSAQEITTKTSSLPSAANLNYASNTIAVNLTEQTSELQDLDKEEDELESTGFFLPWMWDNTTDKSTSSGLAPTLLLGIGALGVVAFLRRPR